MSVKPSDPETLSVSPIINISCYKFVTLDNLADRRSAIHRRAVELGLRGTVLISHEGINLFVAGPRDAIHLFVDFLRSDPAFSDLQPKESANDYQPFNRMLVKVKKEIIAFGIDGVAPGQRTSPKLPARELKKWLDEGRKVHLLDTRNDYEYDLGTFDNAIKMGLDHFREFPDAVARLPHELKNEPIVMFCTGGIRCEKAGPFLEMAGYKNVYQLDGGILKYFEEVGGDHYHGECFVFDQRVAVDPSLKETPTTQCYICQEVVTTEQQKLPSYVPGKSCPACYSDDALTMANLIESRHLAIRAVTSPLPGAEPCLNRRPLNVPQRYAGMTLIDFLSEIHPQVPREEWLNRICSSAIVPAIPVRRRRRSAWKEETLPLSPDRIVREGEKFDQLEPMSLEPDVSADIRILFEDHDLIVLIKPAPLPVHASGRFNRNTLRHILNLVWMPQRPHIVHRLDANTSGVMVLCQRKRVATLVQKQFENRTVQKTYLAKIVGHPPDLSFECDAPLSREPYTGGVRLIDPSGDDASTVFDVISLFEDGTSLVRAIPRTGRTNQIRAHLWHMGFPIVGDPAYLPNGQIGTNHTLLPSEPPMCLHSASLRFVDGKGMEQYFESPNPDWAKASTPCEG